MLGPLTGPGNMQSWDNVASERTTAEEHLGTMQGLSDWSSSNPFLMLTEVCWKQLGVSGDVECSSCHPSRDTEQITAGVALGSASPPGQGEQDRGSEGMPQPVHLELNLSTC